MIYITDILSMFSNGKVNADASDVLGKLKEGDRVVLLSDTGELVVNADILSLLTKANGQITIEKCASDFQIVFVLGKYFGSGDSIRLTLKNTDLIKSLDFLKGNDAVLFGWKSASKKGGSATKKPRASNSKKKRKIAEDDSFMKFEEPAVPEEKTSIKRVKKERPEEKKEVTSSNFLDLSIESVLGEDAGSFHKAGLHQIKELYVYDKSRKKWANIITKEEYDLICTKLTAFGQPSLKNY